MALKVTTEPRENRQLAMSIEVPQERVDKELRKAAAKVAGQYRVPGFRKGKAPFHVVVQQVGLANLYGEFVDDLGQEMYKQAIEQENIEPYAVASLEDIQFDPLTFKLLVPLEPVAKLGDYRSLRIAEPQVEVDEELVNQQLERVREQFASWQSVERPSQFGDMMTIDVRSVIVDEDGSETVVLEENDWDVTPDQEHPMDPPGFDAALIDLSPGDEKEFSLSWPEESRSIHAGKVAAFRVTVKEIQSYEKAEINDDLAKLVGPDFQTVEDLTNNIRQTLARTEAERSKGEHINEVLDAIVEMSELDYPPVMIEDQLDSMMQEFDRRLRMFGIESIDKYFEQTNQDKNEYRESMRPEAGQLALRNLVLSELLKVERVQVTDEDIDERIEAMINEPGQSDQDQEQAMANMLRSSGGRSVLESQILRDKTIERMLAIVHGEDVPELRQETPATEQTGQAEHEPTVADESETQN